MYKKFELHYSSFQKLKMNCDCIHPLKFLIHSNLIPIIIQFYSFSNINFFYLEILENLLYI